EDLLRNGQQRGGQQVLSDVCGYRTGCFNLPRGQARLEAARRSGRFLGIGHQAFDRLAREAVFDNGGRRLLRKWIQPGSKRQGLWRRNHNGTSGETRGTGSPGFHHAKRLPKARVYTSAYWRSVWTEEPKTWPTRPGRKHRRPERRRYVGTGRWRGDRRAA